MATRFSYFKRRAQSAYPLALRLSTAFAFFAFLSCTLSCSDDTDDPAGDSHKNKTFKIGNAELEMVYVKGGTFQMGATKEQINSHRKIDDHEFPVHQVTVSSYYIGKYEVTEDLYNAVMGLEESADRTPINGTWAYCDAFIQKLNEKTGMKFRMPTEAEWEYAARGGRYSKGYVFPGSNSFYDVAWCYGNSGDDYLVETDWNWWVMTGNHCSTHVAGARMPNELGIYDMGGNIYEWCSDWYGPYSKEAQTDPKGPETGSSRVCRGGSYAHFSDEARVSHRRGSPSSEQIYWGCRLALDTK